MFNELSNVNFLKTVITVLSFSSLFDDDIVDSSHLISEKYKLITVINSMHTVYLSFPQLAFKSIGFKHLLNQRAKFFPTFCRLSYFDNRK